MSVYFGLMENFQAFGPWKRKDNIKHRRDRTQELSLNPEVVGSSSMQEKKDTFTCKETYTKHQLISQSVIEVTLNLSCWIESYDGQRSFIIITILICD